MSNGYKGQNKDLPDIALAVIKGINQDLINKVEKFAGQFQASNSQVRNIFTAVKRIEAREFDRESFLMLRPRLAYAAQRDWKLRDLKKALSPAVDAVLDTSDKSELDKRFHRFCLCCEAIVAYAKK